MATQASVDHRIALDMHVTGRRILAILVDGVVVRHFLLVDILPYWHNLALHTRDSLDATTPYLILEVDDNVDQITFSSIEEIKDIYAERHTEIST